MLIELYKAGEKLKEIKVSADVELIAKTLTLVIETLNKMASITANIARHDKKVVIIS